MWPAALFVSLFACLLLIWFLRPNTASVAPGLNLQTWEIVSDGWHNGFTDMLFWQERFFMVYVSSPAHFASPRSRLVILSSQDALRWDEIARLQYDGKDIRDPKLAVIRGELFLFALLNVSFDPQPYGTVFSKSSDGKSWTPFKEIEPAGWLFGHPKSADGERWFVSAHWRAFDRAAVLDSLDGENWQVLSVCAEKPGLDETALEFLPDGRMLIVIRYEAGGGLLGSGQAATLLITSLLPVEQFQKENPAFWSEPVISPVTRLDSPQLFSHNGKQYAVGRYQPFVSSPLQQRGSTFSRKRTSIFLADPGKLIHLTDLPSAGDTAYAGVVLRAGRLFVSYYSSSLKRDYPWLLGMFCPTSIQLASLDLAGLEQLYTSRSAL